MDLASSIGLSKEALFWLSIYTMLFGALIVILIIVFALFLLHARRWWWRKEPYPLKMLIRDLHHTLMDGPLRKEALAVGVLLGSA